MSRDLAKNKVRSGSAALNTIQAPAGQVWVCVACGRRAPSRYGHGGDRGWDASCLLNARLALESHLVVAGDPPRVVEVLEGGWVDEV